MPPTSKPRRPSQTDAGYGVASSNSTVNAFIGGRQPSWMSNATPVQPTPRSKPAHQNIPQAPSKAPATVLPSPAPSDEPSPAVSNPQDSPNPQSATLTEKKTQDAASMDIRGSGGVPVSEARFVPNAQFNQQGNRHVSANILPQGNATKRPAQVMDHQQSSTAVLPPPPTSAGRLVHPMNMTQVWPPVPPDPVAADHSAKRRKTSSTANLVQISEIALQLDSLAAQPSLTDIERARIQILRDACGKNDAFYITFHQLFCLWSLGKYHNNMESYAYLSIHPQVVDAGFKIMETVLKGNDNVSTANLQFFANFPCPMRTLLSAPGIYQDAVARVSVFLQSLPQRWPSLVNDSFKRGFPYLVDELLKKIPCPSVVLQTILFTASRRRLGVRDGPLGVEIDQLFKKDQAAHMTTNGDFVGVDYELYGPEWGVANAHTRTEYQRIVRTFQAVDAVRRVSADQPGQLRNNGSGVNPAQGAPDQRIADRRRPAAITGHTQMPNNNTYSPQLPGSAGFVASPTQMSPSFAHAQGPVVQQSDLSPSNNYPNIPTNLVLQSSYATSPPALTSPMPVSHGPQFLHDPTLYQLQNAQNVQFNNQYQMHARCPAQAPTQAPAQASPPVAMAGAPGVLWTTMAPQNGTLQPVTSMGLPAAYVGPQFATPQVPIRTHLTRVMQQPQPPMAPTASPGNLLPPRGFEIPRNEHASSPNDRKAILMSLHQADLQSPPRVRRPEENSEERYYQAVKSFAAEPVYLDPSLYLQNVEFHVSYEDLGKCCMPRKIPGNLLTASEYFDGSLRYRLRCCKLSGLQVEISESDWVTSEVSWPKSIWMKLNDQTLSVRRKPHNGKDLPIELTPLLKPGKNVLRVAAASLPKSQKGGQYFVAIDIVECFSHSKTVENIWKRGLLKKEDTLAKITSRLRSAPSDDELAIANQDLKITLADPWSFSIFTTPVRGATCTHLECFDLENWLQTRPPSKPNGKCAHGDNVACNCLKAKEPSHADKWKCPICDKDARPGSLRIDSFLLDVRRRLEHEGKLGVKSIVVIAVDSDVRWRPEIDPDDDDDDGDSDDDKDGAQAVAAPKNLSSAPPVKAQSVEVIELLDDD